MLTLGEWVKRAQGPSAVALQLYLNITLLQNEVSLKQKQKQ